MMKSIAIVSSQAFSLVNFRGALINKLVRNGVLVYAIAPDFTVELRKKIEELGALPIDFPHERAGMNPYLDFFAFLRLTRLLLRLSPDVCLGYSVKPVIYGMLAAWLAGIKHRVAMVEGLGYVFTHSTESSALKRRILRRVVLILYRLALFRTHWVIFLNRDDLVEFVDSGVVDAKKTVELGGIGIDLSEWMECKPVVSPVTFIMVARLLREKGVLEYVESAKIIKEQYPEVKFFLLGGTDQNPGSFSEKQVQSWVAEGVVLWPGHVDVMEWIKQSSVFVLPSYREGVPRSTQEAMALGRPVITTDVPGCRETVVAGLNGILVPPRDVPALVDAMRWFIENPSKIEPMGMESRRIAEVRFDVHQINERLAALLNEESYIGK